MPIDFSEFEGEFKKHDGKWVYMFPSIKNIIKNKTRVWNIIIYIDNLHCKELYDNSYYEDKKINVSFWTEHYIISEQKIQKSEETKVISGKNIGKINETNIFTQALIMCNSLYQKRLSSTGNSKNKFWYPQACHKYDDTPVDESKHLVFPCFIQPKIDGIRGICTLDNKEIIIYSRKLKNIPLEHLEKQLLILYKYIDKKIYLDGELYKHGFTLQEVSSLVKNQSVRSNVIEFHIFDMFIPEGNNKEKLMTFEERLYFINNLQNIITENKLDKIKIVETFEIKNIKSGENIYKNFLDKKYEGVIYKNKAGIYETSKNKEMRSYQIRKRKPRHSSEYKIIDYKCGINGKEKNAIIWVLETKEGNIFTSVPIHITMKERIELYNNMTEEIFNSEYKNKMMTVEYDDLSNDLIPLRAKAICVREID